MKCLICEHESQNYRGLGNHIRKAYNMNTKDYYELYDFMEFRRYSKLDRF